MQFRQERFAGIKDKEDEGVDDVLQLRLGQDQF